MRTSPNDAAAIVLLWATSAKIVASVVREEDHQVERCHCQVAMLV